MHQPDGSSVCCLTLSKQNKFISYNIIQTFGFPFRLLNTNAHFLPHIALAFDEKSDPLVCLEF